MIMKNAIKFILFAKLLTKTGNPQTDVKPEVQGQITQSNKCTFKKYERSGYAE